MTTPDVQQSIKQLDDARKLVLGDANYYPQIIQGILPIIGPTARVELRRWGADFLAETFASPSVPAHQKESLCLIVLETLRVMIENTQEDAAVVKSIVQVAASVYPLVIRWLINNAYDKDTWERMAAIKSRILRIWDTATSGIRICCIKFAQRVVLAQTTGPEADSRRGEPSEVSLTMIPSHHTLLVSRNLEAEASGLLDRLLAVFQDDSGDAVIIDATLNTLSTLISSRPQTANKIINSILNFNPLKQANSPMTPKTRVMVKSMEKTTRMLLIHLLKRDPKNPLSGRMHQYIERTMRSRAEIFDDAIRKRGPPETIDGLDAAKRQKLDGRLPVPPVIPKFEVPPLNPGPHTTAELFTVTTDEALKSFDVAMLPEDLVVKIGITILQRLDANTLNQAIEGIKERYNTMNTANQPELMNPNTALLGVEEDEDDYDPDFTPAEDAEQILNKLDATTSEPDKSLSSMELGQFKLPPPPRLSPEEVAQIGQGTITRVFGVMQTLDEPNKKERLGLNRLAASAYDKEAWITIITRLATRATDCLEQPETAVKAENGAPKLLSDTIRCSLYMYIIEDFRKRIDIAVSWLCEEWYNDKIQARMNKDAPQHYETWALKLLDGIVPYLDARDKILTRFLSEIPLLNAEILGRVKSLCRDPATVNLSLTSLLYLVMFRPPVRDIALDAVEDAWTNYDDARPMAAKYLSKWRPGFAERIQSSQESKEEGFRKENMAAAITA